MFLSGKIREVSLSLSKDQWTLGQCRTLLRSCILHAVLFLIILMIFWHILVLLCQSCMGQTRSLLETAFFSPILFPKSYLGSDASRVSYREIQAVTADPGNFSHSVWAGLEVIQDYWAEYESNTGDINYIYKFLRKIIKKKECHIKAQPL